MQAASIPAALAALGTALEGGRGAARRRAAGLYGAAALNVRAVTDEIARGIPDSSSKSSCSAPRWTFFLVKRGIQRNDAAAIRPYLGDRVFAAVSSGIAQAEVAAPARAARESECARRGMWTARPAMNRASASTSTSISSTAPGCWTSRTMSSPMRAATNARRALDVHAQRGGAHAGKWRSDRFALSGVRRGAALESRWKLRALSRRCHERLGGLGGHGRAGRAVHRLCAGIVPGGRGGDAR